MWPCWATAKELEVIRRKLKGTCISTKLLNSTLETETPIVLVAARFLKCACPFWDVMHQRVKDIEPGL